MDLVIIHLTFLLRNNIQMFEYEYNKLNLCIKKLIEFHIST